MSIFKNNNYRDITIWHNEIGSIISQLLVSYIRNWKIFGKHKNFVLLKLADFILYWSKPINTFIWYKCGNCYTNSRQISILILIIYYPINIWSCYKRNNKFIIPRFLWCNHLEKNSPCFLNSQYNGASLIAVSCVWLILMTAFIIRQMLIDHL